MGTWKGASVSTGHPVEQRLTNIKWAGRTFRSTEDVNPIEVYKEDGVRVWNTDWGHARVNFLVFLISLEAKYSLSTASPD
jgi:hypothetical protein